jgi:hypothetical protein
MTKNRSTFIYLALALGFVCYLTFIDNKIPGTKEQEESENELFKFDRDDVTGLEINNVHGSFVFQKKGDHWEIKSPVDTPADRASVEEVINQIAYAQPQRVIQIDANDPSTPGTLKKWGLAPAAERALIHTKDKTYELLVGRKMAINDSVYARASGRKNAPVRIIPNMVKTVLEKDLADFRSRNVFDFDASKVTKVASRISDTATTPAQECEVALESGKWTLQKPLVARAAEPDVQTLLNKILGLRVVDFTTDAASNLSQYGLTTPSATLSVTVQPQEELMLQIGSAVPNKPDQVYAQMLTSNSVFTLTKTSLDDVLNALPSVRDRHILPFDPAKAAGLTFSFGKKNGEVRNEKGLWNTIGMSAGRADVGKVTDLLTRLSQLETTPTIKDSATDLKPFGLDKPQGKILVRGHGDESLTLLIGKDENKLLYVRNSTEPFIYSVPDNSFDFLPDNNLGLRDGRAIDLQLSLVKSMTITAPPTPAVVLTRSPGGTWTASNVKDRMVDSVKADVQASLFCQLEAKEWLGPVQPSYGLSKPVLTIEMKVAEGKPTVLRIGGTLPNGDHVAMLQSDPTVFGISDADYGMLNASSVQPIPSVVPAPDAAPKTPDKK